MEYKLNWRPDKPDIRDFRFHSLLSAVPQPSLPKVDLRPLNPPIYDQQNIGSCFHESTKIKLLNGKTESIGRLFEIGEKIWVYSCLENGEMVPALAEIKLTGVDKELIEITLDNLETIKCTPDHEFMLRDGSYKKAADLTSDDSLMSQDFKLDIGGKYLKYFNNFKNRWESVHTLVNNTINLDGRLTKEKLIKTTYDKYLITHHIDFNKLNNSPTNLEWMGDYEHFCYHSCLLNHLPNIRKIRSENCKKQWKKNPKWSNPSKGGKNAWIKARKDKKIFDKVNIGLEKGRKDKEVRRRAGQSISMFHKNLSDTERKVRSIRRKKLMKTIVKNNLETFRNNGLFLAYNRGKNSALKCGNRILKIYGELNEINWNLHRYEFSNNPLKWKTALSYFKDLDEFISSANQYNHFVIKIKKIEGRHNVYCLTVPKYNNFLLDSGVYVHNCTANAWCRLLEFLSLQDISDSSPDGPTVFDKKYIAMSRLYLYYNERLLGSHINQDSGAELRDGMKALLKWGICEEDDWRYSEGNLFLRPSQHCYDTGLNHRITTGYRITDGNLEAMKLCLQQGYPFVFGISIYDSFDTTSVRKTGIIPMPTNNDRLIGGHAITAVGFDNSQSVLICANSWGTDWGDKGYFYLPYDYVLNSDLSCDYWTARK